MWCPKLARSCCKCFPRYDGRWTRKFGRRADLTSSYSRTPRCPRHQCKFRSDSCRRYRTTRVWTKARVLSKQGTFVWPPYLHHQSESLETRTPGAEREQAAEPSTENQGSCALRENQRRREQQESARRQTVTNLESKRPVAN